MCSSSGNLFELGEEARRTFPPLATRLAFGSLSQNQGDQGHVWEAECHLGESITGTILARSVDPTDFLITSTFFIVNNKN